MKTSLRARLLLIQASASLALSCFGFQQAFAADNNNSTKMRAELHSAILLYNSFRYKDALPLLDTVLKSEPNEVMAHYYRGLCMQNLNQLTDATQEFDWVIKNGKAPTLAGQAERAKRQISTVQSVLGSDGKPKAGGQRPKVYDFYTTWCGPCKVLKPIFDSVEHEYKGKVDMISLDAEDPANKAIVEKYQIFGYPTLVFVDSLGRKVDEATGLVPKTELERRVKKLLSP